MSRRRTGSANAFNKRVEGSQVIGGRDLHAS